MTAPPSPMQDARFPKTERLLRRSEFLRVQRHGARFRTSNLVVMWTPSASNTSRIGITVSRKVGNAPVRVQVKRWIREVYRQHKERWPAGTDFVVIARRRAARVGYWGLRADLLRWAETGWRPPTTDPSSAGRIVEPQ